MKNIRMIFPVILVLVGIILTGCRSATITHRTDFVTSPLIKPVAVYVEDFSLQTENIKKDSSVLSVLPDSHGPVRARLLGQSNNPQKLARQLVNLMADSIVHDLTKAGFVAKRLAADAPMPADGWVVRGVFTEVQQGNRLRRAVIGLGLGKTDLQVVSDIDNLANGQPKPLYEIASDANSGELPGAAATIVISPLSVPLRFVLSGHDLQKNVKKTAAKISDEVNLRVLSGK